MYKRVMEEKIEAKNIGIWIVSGLLAYLVIWLQVERYFSNSLISSIMYWVFSFGIDFIVSGSCLWLAFRFFKMELYFKGALLIVATSSVISLLPGIGTLLSVVVFYFLLWYATKSSFLDLFVTVLLSKLLAISLGVILVQLVR